MQLLRRLLILTLPLTLFCYLASAQTCQNGFAAESGISGVNNTAVWTGDVNLTGAPDGSGAEILSFTPLSAGRSSSRLGVWDFGINIPCNAVVTDLSFDITRRNDAASGDVVDENVYVRLPDFTLSTGNGATTGSWANGSYETVTYNPAGGWGVMLTPDLVNDPLFGLILTVNNQSGTEDGFPQVDAINMTVCYTVNGTAYETITATVVNNVENFCTGSAGDITINATGGSGTYEYSIDGGQTWVANNIFSSVGSDNHEIAVRDVISPACETNLGAYYVGCNDTRILQYGDAIYTCLPTPTDQVTLAIDRIQPLHDLYQNGFLFEDASPFIQTKAFSWTTSDLGGTVYGVTYDENYNIYTGLSTMFQLISTVSSADLIRIDGMTGVPTVIATLPGEKGIAQVEYDQTCSQLYVSNLDDGMIYRYDTAGNLLSTFDPLLPDDGTLGLAALGERVVALGFNPVESRLYYSVWSNDFINNGNRNTIRSISIDPATCDFVNASDQLEVTMPFISETESGSKDYSHPVLDIEFNEAGNIMLLGESGFNSSIPASFAHESRLLGYDGSSLNWVLDNTPSGTNQDYKYEIGTQSDGTNSLGGVDFAYAGIDGGGCTNGIGEFIAATGDALKGVDCTFSGCLYGLQFTSIDGGSPENSVLLDLARAPDSQQKGFFGDLDVVTGCCPCACMPIGVASSQDNSTVCLSQSISICADLITGGVAPYTYAWSDGFTDVTECISVSPTSDQTYMVTITDDAGCTGIGSITVIVSSDMTAMTVTTSATSCVTPNGTITVTESGGTPPYTYSIDAGVTSQASNVFNGLAQGTYDVLVTDDLGCTTIQSAVIDGMTAITMSTTTTQSTSCLTNNGTIAVTASGGVAPFSYSIDGGTTTQASSDFVGLMAGSYTVLVIDAVGCEQTEDVDVIGPSSLNIALTASAQSDCQIPNGSISVTASGGTAPYSYSIDGGVTTQASNSFTGLTAGNYTIVLIDDGGCMISDMIEVTGPSALNIALTGTDQNNCQVPNGSISVIATGGTAPYSYSIDGGVTTQVSNNFVGLTAGSYTVTVIDAGGCTVSDMVSIAGPSALNITLSGTDQTDCTIPNGSIMVMASGGTAPYTYSIDGGVSTQASSSFQGLMAGSYTVMVIDDGGCMISDDIDIMGPTALGLTLTSEDQTSCQMPNGAIMVTVNGGTPPYTYSVDGGVTTQASNVFSGLMAGNYVVLAIDDGGCDVSQSIDIAGPSSLDLVLIEDAQTNCITPNGGIMIAVTGGTAPYSYSIDGGLTFSPDNFFVDLTAGNYVVVVSDAGGCQMTTMANIALPICGGSVGDFIFEDTDGDGFQDLDEVGVPGVRIELYNDRDILLDITFSDDDGRYIFDDVPPGDYYIRIDSPDGFLTTDAHQSDNTSTDSDVDNSNGTGTTAVFTLQPGEDKTSVDVGIYECIPIGESIWFDFNQNDIFDEGENGINGVRVELFKLEDGFWFLEDFTHTGSDPNTPSGDGYYTFCAPPGTYHLKFHAPQRSFVRAVPNVGFNDDIDSDITDNNGIGTTDQFEIFSGDMMNNIGAGYYLGGALGDFVWFDENLNGLMEGEEEGVQDVFVRAMSLSGETMASTRSDANGNYRLEFLPKDHYYIEVQVPEEYIVTRSNEGNDEVNDSDIDGSNGPNTSQTYLVNPGEVVSSVDIGLVLRSLPVEWLDIRGEAKDGYNLIEWDIASESNVSHYELQYSYGNTLGFQTVGEIESEETNYQGFLNYSLAHPDFKAGDNYYRVKQYDLNGKHSFSDIVAISNKDVRDSNAIAVYPNPTSGLINVDLDIIHSQVLQMNLYDNLGRLAVKNIVYDEGDLSGKKTYTFDTYEVIGGVYTLEVQLDKKVYIQKIVINK